MNEYTDCEYDVKKADQTGETYNTIFREVDPRYTSSRYGQTGLRRERRRMRGIKNEKEGFEIERHKGKKINEEPRYITSQKFGIITIFCKKCLMLTKAVFI